MFPKSFRLSAHRATPFVPGCSGRLLRVPRVRAVDLHRRGHREVRELRRDNGTSRYATAGSTMTHVENTRFEGPRPTYLTTNLRLNLWSNARMWRIHASRPTNSTA